MFPLAFTAIAVGAISLIAGVTGSSIRSVATGKPDRTDANPQLDTTSTSSSTGSAVTPGNAQASNGLPTSAHAKLIAISKSKGWSVNDWLAVISIESGGNPAAKNASSGAFGIGQALGSTQTTYPKMVSANAAEQIEGMAEYIEGRYGTPTKALEHEHAYGWY